MNHRAVRAAQTSSVAESRQGRGRVRALLAGVLAVGLALTGATAAQAVSNENVPGVEGTFRDQTFFVYTEAGELPHFVFEKWRARNTPFTITVTDPSGTVQQTCTVPASAPVGPGYCPSTGLVSVEGVWTISASGVTSGGHTLQWNIEARGADQTPIPGRVWVEQDSIGNGGGSNLSYWIGTREGYLYKLDFLAVNGIGWILRSNGFGLVEAGTCTPTYQSVQGSALNNNLPAGVEFGDACGDDYKLFLEAPAADLPATAPIAGGTEWIRPAVVPASAQNLQNIPDNPFTRAGSLDFDLAGVNGGYTVQVDVDNNGSYADAVDRTIPWGSPPGEVSVPFDGLDGLGQPISVCQAVGARVVVDRVGEMHFVLDDVERLGGVNTGGVKLTGQTPGVVSANPKVYWDDRNLAVSAGLAVFPSADGRTGVDTSGLAANVGTHRWAAWGDLRSIENWTYYQAQAEGEVEIPGDCNPALALDKTGELNDANANGVADAGETIDYSFTVRNTGNSAVTDVTIADPRVTGVSPASAGLAVLGEQVFTAAPYTVTQADIDAGGVTNTASASGLDPFGDDVISNDDTHSVPTAPRTPSLVLDKVAELNDANGNGVADLGETIDYTFEVENTGNVTLTGVAIDDPRVTGLSPASAAIAPGDTVTFTAAPYTVAQTDLNTGSVDNTAVANGTSVLGPLQSNTDSTTVPTPTPDPELALEKTAVITTDADGDGRADVGDVITYTFDVTNTGTVDVSSVSVIDPRVAVVTPVDADIPANGLAEFTATYTATQADVDFGSIPNTAYAEGTYSGDEGVVDVMSAPDTALVQTPDRAPALTLDKDGTLDDTNGNGFADLGETIDYTFTVTNTGNVTMEGVNVIDTRGLVVTPGSVTLAPQGVQVFTSNDYVVTQGDIDSGEVLNLAFARGNVPGSAEIHTVTDRDTQPVAAAAPALTIDKVGTLQDEDGDGVADAGEAILYTFTVSNTGNVTLYEVGVADSRIAGLTPASVDYLLPTQSFVFEAEPYVVTDADVAEGEIVNVATATGLDPTGVDIESDPDTVTTNATPPAPVDPADPADPTAPNAGGLASTGADSGHALTAAVLLMLGGAVLLVLRRQRRRA